MKITVKDNSAMTVAEMKAAVARALERVGKEMETRAAALAPVDTGNLRGSIDHKVSEQTVYVGSNASYAAYVEYGTGYYSTHPDGGTSKDKWAYYDELKGKWRTGYPQQPQPYLKPAVEDNLGTYENIIKDELKG